MRVGRWVAAIAALFLAAGCSDGDPPARPPTDDYDVEGASCGQVKALFTGEVAQQAVDCLLAALDEGRDAHLVVTTTTVEGDPLFTAYQVRAQGIVVVVRDSRWDEYGAKEITRQRCTREVSAAAVDEVRGDGGRSLSVGDCRPES